MKLEHRFFYGNIKGCIKSVVEKKYNCSLGKIIEVDKISTNITESLYYQKTVPKRDRITKTKYSYDEIGILKRLLRIKRKY